MRNHQHIHSGYSMPIRPNQVIIGNRFQLIMKTLTNRYITSSSYQSFKHKAVVFHSMAYNQTTEEKKRKFCYRKHRPKP
jgi:hypothetical protein